MHETLVIGGGVAGLAAAARLARAGLRPLLLESRPRLGGRAMVVRQHGFTLNYGYHFILGGARSPHLRLLRHLGLRVPGRFTSVTGFYTVQGDRPRPLLGAPIFHPAFGVTNLRLLLARPGRHAGETLDSYLNTLTASDAVRQWLLNIARPISFLADGGRLPADRFLRWYQYFAGSPIQPSLVFPWDRFTDALANYVTAHGGEIRTSSPVARITPATGAVTVQMQGGDKLTARAAVVAVPPGSALAGLFDPAHQAPFMTGGEPTVGVTLDLGFAGPRPRGIAWDFPAERAVVSCHSNVDPGLAPPGHHLVQGLLLLTAAEVADAGRVDAARATLLRLAERAFPGSTAAPVLRRWLVHRQLTSLAHTGQPLAPITDPLLPGVAFCSDGADVPGELSFPAITSAELAAEHIRASTTSTWRSASS